MSLCVHRSESHQNSTPICSHPNRRSSGKVQSRAIIALVPSCLHPYAQLSFAPVRITALANASASPRCGTAQGNENQSLRTRKRCEKTEYPRYSPIGFQTRLSSCRPSLPLRDCQGCAWPAWPTLGSLLPDLGLFDPPIPSIVMTEPRLFPPAAVSLVDIDLCSFPAKPFFWFFPAAPLFRPACSACCSAMSTRPALRAASATTVWYFDFAA